MSLSGWVCVVTGASRGIGKGIALQLSEAGATVYITGRQKKTLEQTAAEVSLRLMPNSVNHQNLMIFDLINSQTLWETHSDLVSLQIYRACPILMPVLFIFSRGHYVCSVYAARMMVDQGKGLIVTISSFGGLRYLFNVPYGIGKAACDRLAADTAVELKKQGVASVSLWPGTVQTELLTQNIVEKDNVSGFDPSWKQVFNQAETTELSGRCIVELAKDKNLMSFTGKVLLTCKLARRYGIKDIDGRDIMDYTSLKFLLTQSPHMSWLSVITPSFIKVPTFVFSLAASKF
uniref:Dehydrogenase/reductase (SDR family) member 1 n=1 Tax=Astyanax mexicanus TaxID=7994 RepID=A0A8B9LSH9_ASTMX